MAEANQQTPQIVISQSLTQWGGTVLTGTQVRCVTEITEVGIRSLLCGRLAKKMTNIIKQTIDNVIGEYRHRSIEDYQASEVRSAKEYSLLWHAINKVCTVDQVQAISQEVIESRKEVDGNH